MKANHNVFQSVTHTDSKVVLTEMQKDGINIVVAVQIGRGGKVNSVRSIYPKDNSNEILRWIAEDNLMEWADKEKALDWINRAGVIPAKLKLSPEPQDASPIKGGDFTQNAKRKATKIIQEFENPTIDEDGSRTYTRFMAENEKPVSQPQDKQDAAKKKTQGNRIEQSPLPGCKRKEIRHIIRDFKNAAKTRIFYTKVGRRAAGTYNSSEGAICLRYAGDLDTTAHEAGHDIDDRYKVIEAILQNPAARAELVPFVASPAASKPPKGHPNPQNYLQREGFAEWLRDCERTKLLKNLKANHPYDIVGMKELSD